MENKPEPYKIKIVGEQSKALWEELAKLMAECREKGWPLKVILDGDEARESLRASGVGMREKGAAPPSDAEPAKKTFWSRLFG